ncbi:hypothetical protein [Polaromonas sp.]|uniref:hypothetical protein n=1 Tax=Polaromonas sp. TaxID=1869339 RepID=UPI002730ECBE|nr:hypothetical protein [Polaromonas sp.]MDP1740943.1 hypothetical protein [Polaromonas sp.]
MNIYVIDHRGLAAATEVASTLRELDPGSTLFPNISFDTAVDNQYDFPALFFIHAGLLERAELENTLTNSYAAEKWALVHFYRDASWHQPKQDPRICPEIYDAVELLQVERQWLLMLRNSTLNGGPEFSGGRENLPTAAVAALLMQKAGLDFSLVPGLDEAAQRECPDGQYEQALKSYFARVRPS